MTDQNPVGKSQLVIEKLVERSTFVFQGVVENVRSVTMPMVIPINDMTAVVRVDEVLKVPKVMGDLVGKDITLQQLNKYQKSKVGTNAIFFSNGWLYGESIAVIEVDRIEVGKDNISMTDKVKNEIKKVLYMDLQGRIANAEIVMVGKVLETKIANIDSPRRITEHDPQWWLAVTEVESVEKGLHDQKVVHVYFPNSRDIMWYRAPKFYTSQDGIWLLHRGETKEISREYFTALDPLDFHPKRDLEEIKRLIKYLETDGGSRE